MSASPAPATSTEPVVLVHGWGGSFRTTWQQPGWDALLADAGRSVIGVDLLGHGEAPKPHDPAAYDDLGARIVDALPDEPVAAVGFSLGAMTLLKVVSQMPERFTRLVVMGVGDNLFREDEERHKAIVAAVSGTGGTDNVEAMLFAQYANQPGNDPEALAAIMRRRKRPVSREDLARVTVPTLIVIGDKDFAGPGDPLLAALPNATMRVLRNVDHFATTEAFAAIDAVLEFLGALPG
jgi:pimeloyl-ACP methyl ester carboxylesterase